MAKAKKAVPMKQAPGKRGAAKKVAVVEKPVVVEKQVVAQRPAPAEKPVPVEKPATTERPATVKKPAAAKKAAKPAVVKASRPQGIEKKYDKNSATCKVTFVLPKDAAPEAESVCILGEFNNWGPDVNRMQKLPEGDFAITLELEAGRSYRFRYMIDGWKYENDWYADRYEPNLYGSEDSVVDV